MRAQNIRGDKYVSTTNTCLTYCILYKMIVLNVHSYIYIYSHYIIFIIYIYIYILRTYLYNIIVELDISGW